MKINRIEIKLLAACVLYALVVSCAYADEWTGRGGKKADEVMTHAKAVEKKVRSALAKARGELFNTNGNRPAPEGETR